MFKEKDYEKSENKTKRLVVKKRILMYCHKYS